MKLIPQNDYVLCEKIKEDTQDNSLIFYDKDEFPLYKIIEVGRNIDDFRYSVNDKIICNSTGTRVKLDNSYVYLFKTENIIGKIG